MSDDGGVWRTINGTPVFIKDGQSVSDAVKERFGDKGKTESGKEGSGGKGHRPVRDVKDIPHTTDISAQDFRDRLLEAKATIGPKDAWRVDSTHSVSDYENDQRFAVGDKSTVAVTKDGDIISVCRADKDNVSGREVLKVAIANGGTKLDAFGRKLYDFYTGNGFEPVSWTRFDETYDVPGWVKGRDEPEPVIFYRYTGRTTDVSYNDFLSRVRASDDYGAAKSARDKSM